MVGTARNGREQGWNFSNSKSLASLTKRPVNQLSDDGKDDSYFQQQVKEMLSNPVTTNIRSRYILQ